MNSRIVRFEHKAMSTLFELMIATEEREMAASAAHAVFQKINKIELMCSRFIDASEVALVSHLKPGQTLRVAPELMELLLISTRVCAATGGCFDVTVGSVMDSLRQVRNRWRALTAQELQEAFAQCGMHRLILDPDNLLLAVKPDRNGYDSPLELDFGGVAKGFALDLICDLLVKEWDFSDFLVHAGTSTVVALGNMERDRVGWPVRVGGDWCVRAGVDAVRLSRGSISGSGFEVKGAHVVDTRRAGPAERHDGAWAYAPTAAVADALSTACLGMRPREIAKACEVLEGSGALTAREQPRWLDHWRAPVRTFGAFPVEAG